MLIIRIKIVIITMSIVFFWINLLLNFGGINHATALMKTSLVRIVFFMKNFKVLPTDSKIRTSKW